MTSVNSEMLCIRMESGPALFGLASVYCSIVMCACYGCYQFFVISYSIFSRILMFEKQAPSLDDVQ